MARWLWLLFFALLTCNADAATRYARQGGSGTACTVQSTPCTFATAISQAGAGDTVVLLSAGGNFTSTMTISGKTGPITITGLGTAHLTTVSGNCMNINSGSTLITVEAMEIGSCAANGILITGASSFINIYDNYIHTNGVGCCEAHTGLVITGASHDIEAQGNVFAFSESSMSAHGDGDNTIIHHVTMHGNYSLNPRGPGQNNPRGQHFQSFGTAANQSHHMTITSNYFQTLPGQLFNASMEDHINFGYTDDVLVDNNYIDASYTAGNSTSGQGIIADIGSDRVVMSNNKIYNQSHGCIAITFGFDHDINNNRCFNDNATTGFTDPNANGIVAYAGDGACGNIQIRNNVAFSRRNPNNHIESSYIPGECSNVTQTANQFDNGGDFATPNATIQGILTPWFTKFPPPLIPPLPKNCVAVSPYSTQTSHASCDGTVPPCPG